MRVDAGTPEATTVMRVLLDGIDVTNRCVAFDATLCYVELLVQDEQGRFVVENDTVKREVKRGTLTIDRREVSE